MAQKALRMTFRMRIGLGKHVDQRKHEVVQVPMIVELALTVIKRVTSNFGPRPIL